MKTLAEFAAQFEVDAAKPFFPVNSLRLLYFIIADHYAPGNTDLIQKISDAIPLVEAVFTARAEYRRENAQATPVSEKAAAAAAIEKLHNEVGTPGSQAALDQLFGFIYPLQDSILSTLFQDYSQDGPLSDSHLALLLRTRAMDSFVFSKVLGELIAKAVPMSTTDQAAMQAEIDLQLHLMYQLNDLVDAVVYAKDDIEANNFSPLQMIRKIAPQPQDTKTLILSMIDGFEKQISAAAPQAEMYQNFALALGHDTMK